MLLLTSVIKFSKSKLQAVTADGCFMATYTTFTNFENHFKATFDFLHFEQYYNDFRLQLSSHFLSYFNAVLFAEKINNTYSVNLSIRLLQSQCIKHTKN